MTLILFVLYIAANGQLTQWLNLFIYSTPSTESVASTSSAADPSGTSTNPISGGSASSIIGGVLGTVGAGPVGGLIGKLF